MKKFLAGLVAATALLTTGCLGPTTRTVTIGATRVSESAPMWVAYYEDPNDTSDPKIVKTEEVFWTHKFQAEPGTVVVWTVRNGTCFIEIQGKSAATMKAETKSCVYTIK